MCLRHSAAAAAIIIIIIIIIIIMVVVVVAVDRKEQHVSVKFCCKLGKSVAKTNLMFKQAFGDFALG